MCKMCSRNKSFIFSKLGFHLQNVAPAQTRRVGLRPKWYILCKYKKKLPKWYIYILCKYRENPTSNIYLLNIQISYTTPTIFISNILDQISKSPPPSTWISFLCCFMCELCRRSKFVACNSISKLCKHVAPHNNHLHWVDLGCCYSQVFHAQIQKHKYRNTKTEIQI